MIQHLVKILEEKRYQFYTADGGWWQGLEVRVNGR